VNFVYFASSPIRITATTCPGGAGGIGNRGDTTLKFPEVSVYDYCPTFATKVYTGPEHKRSSFVIARKSLFIRFFLTRQ
jgi:hypothetical protein